ncbi:MAG TPA: phospholipid carrier-dependent glycosyltransferase [Candidatus Limnocylindrales bacterium]|nr:phospholipid carrier-dependent glycosyltransferase [Candidatus Limnocylindrales bacterium]
MLLLLGLALRLSIAYLLFPGAGFAADLGTFTSWAMTLAEHGPGGFYANAGFADYPPGYLYVLWLVGGLGNLLAPLADGNAHAVTGGLIKLPPMLADIAVGYLLCRLVRGWAGDRPDAERLGLLAAAVYVFNPVTWYDSALWGQTDAIGALVLLLAVAALVRGNSEGAAALTVLAALVKPQFGVVMVPVTGAVLLHRHVFAIGSGPRHTILVPERFGAVRDWFEHERGPWRLVSSAAVGMALMLVLLVPFALDLFGFVELMSGTAGGYPWLSVNAYNPWALVGADGRAPLAQGGGWSPDGVPLLGPLPGVVIGAALLAGAFLLVALRLLWKSDRRSIVIALIVVALAFFILPTRVHERYMFPIFGLLPLMAVIDRRWLWATVALSAAAFINMHGILTTPLYATPNIADLPLGQLFREPLGVYTSVLLHTAGFAFVAWRLLPRFARRADPWAAAGAHDEGTIQPGDPDQAAAGPSVQAAGSPGRVRAWLERSLAVVPLRRDRSAELVNEPAGRLDRRDVVLLLALFLATLGLRGLNVAQPHGMHFDEVYHARTGIEFLQHWRYGQPHSIYEFTHPHLAKYAMALGVERLGNNRVAATSELRTSVSGATLERRWDEDGAVRRGDRAYLATPDGVLVIDLSGHQPVATFGPPARAVAVDEGSRTVYVVGDDGMLWQLPTAALDTLRIDPGAALEPALLARLEVPAGALEVSSTDDRLIVRGEGGLLIAVDPSTGQETGRTVIDGATAVIGIAGEDVPALAVGAADGIVILEAGTLEQVHLIPTAAPVTGMALVEQGVDQPTIYAAAGSTVQTARVPSGEAPAAGDRLSLPAPVRDVFANPATALVHVLGTTPDGLSDTLYVLEPHSNAYFADAVLPFEPLAVLMDVQPRRPADDRLDALAIAADGRVATVDVGSNAFAWRLPGVIAGALMALAMYLLARMLFRRRSVAVLAGLLILLDGMAFANSRIAMNDTYVALFITAAFALFAPLYMGRWRSPLAIAAAVVGVALLLGLALASKWVGAYALGGIVLLILLRSALGRVLALLAMIAMTSLLGYLAISPGPESGQLNFLFLALMIALTAALAVAMTVRPLPFTREELRLVFVGPVVGGVLLLLGAGWLAATAAGDLGGLITPTRLAIAGGAAIVLGGGAYLAGRVLGERGHGPLANTAGAVAAANDPIASSDDEREGTLASPPPPRGWLRPGSGVLGLPWLATLATLVLVPLLIYVLSYAPWVALGNRWTTDLPAGHTGQTLADLTRSMYDYHNNLRATHAASSPWWAWPLDLKPVWFYQRDFAGGTTGTIYNTGNMVLFWLSVPAVVFAAVMAWRRRSPALTLLVLAVASLWLPWARIDRATFQYHVFTAVPFAFLCLAYLLAELWHGPSRRTWAFARLAAAGALLLPALLWLLRLPLCGIAGVNQMNPGADICQVGLARPLALSELQLMGLLGLATGVVVLALAWWWRDRPSDAGGRSGAWLPSLGMVLVGAGLLAALGGAFLPGARTIELPGGAVLMPLLWLAAPLVFLALLAVPAYYILRARDARRFTVGAVIAALAWFVVWYPNVSGLPVPTPLSQSHLVMLPTLNYSFQFGVNTDPPGAGIDWLGVLALGVVVLIVLGSAVQAARNWREAKSETMPFRAAREVG